MLRAYDWLKRGGMGEVGLGWAMEKGCGARVRWSGDVYGSGCVTFYQRGRFASDA